MHQSTKQTQFSGDVECGAEKTGVTPPIRRGVADAKDGIYKSDPALARALFQEDCYGALLRPCTRWVLSRTTGRETKKQCRWASSRAGAGGRGGASPRPGREVSRNEGATEASGSAACVPPIPDTSWSEGRGSATEGPKGVARLTDRHGHDVAGRSSVVHGSNLPRESVMGDCQFDCSDSEAEESRYDKGDKPDDDALGVWFRGGFSTRRMPLVHRSVPGVW